MIVVPKTVVPSTLYKYCPPERVDILESFQVRFSPPSDFHDTFDTHIAPAASNRQTPDQPKVRLAQAMQRHQLGVFCLTELPDNQLMWVNYARNHTGFVLGFRTDDPFFHEEGRVLRKVVYQSSPPLFDPPDVENSCFYKSPEWEYEKEWRYMRSFARSEERLVGIGENLITEIILGYQMEQWNISRISLCMAALNMSPAFFLSTPEHSRWKFVNRPKSVTLCKTCGGDGYLMENRD